LTVISIKWAGAPDGERLAEVKLTDEDKKKLD
jgi:hypothetical protein